MNSNLIGASFHMANLEGAYLCMVHLQWAHLHWANLKGADLEARIEALEKEVYKTSKSKNKNY